MELPIEPNKQFQRSLSRTELKNRLFESGYNLRPPTLLHRGNNLSNLPSVHTNSKGRPIATRGLQFKPQRSTSVNNAHLLPQNQVVLNRKQSAFIAGASTMVEDPFKQEELTRLHLQRERMFQSIEDVQLEEDPGLIDEKEEQLLFKVPVSNQSKMGSVPNLGKQWTQDLSGQLSRFKHSQMSKMLLKNPENTFMPTTKPLNQAQSQALLPPCHPQFQINNLEPYVRPPSQFQQSAMSGGGLSQSQTLKNLGLKDSMTPSGCRLTVPLRQKVIPPSQSGQVPGSTILGPGGINHSQSDAQFNSKIRRIKRIAVDPTKSNASSRQTPHSSMNELPPMALHQTMQIREPKISQSDATEEVLRQHYFMAKVTNRTSHKMLNRESSPQKHLAGATRLERLESIKIQAAALMRLNAVWGLENKDKPMEILKAEVDVQVVAEGGVFFNVLPEAEKYVASDQPATDLEMMISLFMRQPQDNGFFIYLVQGDKNGDTFHNPFDLKPLEELPKRKSKFGGLDQRSQKVDGKARQTNGFDKAVDRYYTLSKKGITSYIDGQPEDYEPLQDWILARSNYKIIRSYNFFKNFRRWKIIKKWRRNEIQKRREEVKIALEEKLFCLDPTFSKILTKHIQNCKELEVTRIIDLTQSTNVGPDDLRSFHQKQVTKRKTITELVRQKSESSRKEFKQGMEDKIQELREQVERSQREDTEQEQFKAKNQDNDTKKQRKLTYHDPAVEALGFRVQLNYGKKSELRKICSRFLRFSYLMDFIATEALTNIYLQSVRETIDRLHELAELPIDYSLFQDEDILESEDPLLTARESQRERSQQSTARDALHQQMAMAGLRPPSTPFIQIEGRFNYYPIMSEERVVKKVNVFLTHPLGTSKPRDFNPTCHLRLQDERVDEEEIDLATQEFVGGPDTLDAYFVERPDKKWLKVEPNCQKLQDEFHNALLEGKQCLRTFERWSRHPDLEKYQAVLETWDDRVCDVWETLPNDRNRLNCEEWLLESPLYNTQDVQINRLIRDAFGKVETFYEQYTPYLQQYWENDLLMHDRFSILTNLKLHNPIESIRMLFTRFRNQKLIFEEFLPETRDIGMIRLQIKHIKQQFIPHRKDCVEILKSLVPAMCEERIKKDGEWLTQQIDLLKEKPRSVNEFVKQIQTLDYLDMTFQEVKDRIDMNIAIFNLCTEFDYVGNQDRHRRFIDDTNRLVYKLNKQMSESREMASQRKDNIKRLITAKVPKLNELTTKFLEELSKPIYIDEETDSQMILPQIEENEVLCKRICEKKTKIQLYQRTLDMNEITPFQNVDEAKQAHTYRARLWRALHEWTHLVTGWQETVFNSIDVKFISEISEKYQKTAIQCEKNLPKESTAVKKLKKLVMAFKETMPIVEALYNQKLEEIHWNEIKRELELEPTHDIDKREMLLGELIKLDVARKQETIIHISVTASQEAALRLKIDTLTAELIAAEFTVEKHGDKEEKYKILSFNPIQTLIDEALAKVSEIQSNRYVKRLSAEVERLQAELLIISETIEQWKECQRNWLYLENVTGIHKPCLTEFDAVNKVWCKHMKNVFSRPQVRINCKEKNLETITQCNQQMEAIQKRLEEHLDKKRAEFPRFFFLSNDELLQLFSQYSSIREINRHINKCFDNVKSFDVEEQLGCDPKIITLSSNEGEMLTLSKPKEMKGFIKSENKLSDWIGDMQDEMQNTVKRRIRELYTTQQKIESNKKDWVIQHTCQSVCVTSMLLWTEQTEEAIQDLDDNPFALQDSVKAQSQALKLLVDIIRQELTLIQRKTIVSLITQEVHCRDILQTLFFEQVESLSDFKWQQQLRYQIEDYSAVQADPEKGIKEMKEVIVRQVNATLLYGYEYMGATSRLIITPLTDKCWLTITGALHIKLSASPAGPAGTGKTESTKDLAKALGMQCVVFNCSEQVEYKIMARLFSGLIQTGAWACLDEFNRIEIEVLSVIAQQLMEIKQGKLANTGKVVFNGSEMDLKQSCGVFVTMNPGYAGRTELPDNLKVLFRPVAMMIPSYQLIAEVMLFAEGFNDAKALSEKMVKLYHLASEQLSQQDHYDFGMRAVKSVLVMAGNLKRQRPRDSENVILIRAMRDSNVPKFLSDDLPLFNALIQDLFPGVDISKQSSGALENQLIKTIDQNSLMRLDNFSLKVIQLSEILLVRFGVMIVGPTGGGKTTGYRVLQQATNTLHEEDPGTYRLIKAKVLNPKSISMGELYGQENIDTKEWTDGLASKIMRKFASAQDERDYWVVFDGPVDALWIENMNTVLDDNMTLCLANGERIKLRDAMRILFEVQDLSEASPATVSRCGMVYMTPNDVGWRPYQHQWIEKFVKQEGRDPLLPPKYLDLLVDLFDQFTDPIFERIDALKSEQLLVCVPIQVIRNCCNYLEYFILNKANHPKPNNNEGWVKYINAIYGYSIIWSCGAHFKMSANRHLDNIFRDFFSRLLIPLHDSVFEYYLDDTKSLFYHFNEIVPKFDYPIEPTPFFNLVIPTIDTARYSSHLKMLCKISKPVFITGFTGTGKSMIVQNFITDNSQAMEFISIILNFSAQTDSASTQNNIESKLEKKRKKSRGAKGTLKTLIFIDDINMPAVEQYGAQPPIELLRQLLDKGGFYDRQALFWKEIEKFTVVAAAAPPGGGRSPLCPRFMRQFHIFNVPEPTDETLTCIFESILGGFLQNNMFNEKLRRTQPQTSVAATIDLYLQIKKNLLPIPAKFHYTFNLRDISKVFQGLLLCNPISIQDNEEFSKLWYHECSRVFCDRLINDADRGFFYSMTQDILNQRWKANWAQNKDNFLPENHPLFSLIMRLDSDKPTYDHVTDKEKLNKVLQEKIIDFNFSASTKLNLVFFTDAVKYLCAITRILMQPRGNAMLIGVSGSGKQSLTTFAAFMLEQKCFQLSLSKNFKPSDFRETIRNQMLVAGCDQIPQTFLMNDTQIMYESFLEDINNILNTGEITNLYQKEDIDRMQLSLEKQLKSKKIPETKENAYLEYIQELRNNFHTILSMSPVGDMLRNRCRKFPSLVNCCTLVWFSSWPIEALNSVATQYLEEAQNVPKVALVSLFPLIHSSVEKAADKFYLELRRKTYITPKSFLDAILTYLDKLSKTRTAFDQALGRLENGVTKLKATNEQIEVLQVKLTELRPQLIEQQKHAQSQIVVIKKQSEITAIKEHEAEEENFKVRRETEKIEKLKLEAEQLLQQAKPELESAKNAVDALNKDDVTELKGTKNPSPLLYRVIECVLVFLGHKKIDWKLCQAEMSKIDFLQSLKNYDKENISEYILKRVQEIFNDKELRWDKTKINNTSKAAGGLARWCTAIFKYNQVIKDVRPKERNVKEMQNKFHQSMMEVEAQQKIVAELKAQVAKMESDLNSTNALITQLETNSTICESRLHNAGKLISLLADEGKRWEHTIAMMHHKGQFIAGDVFLASAEMSYLGPFLGTYREELISQWTSYCRLKELSISDNYSLVQTLGDQVKIREWTLRGLPSDTVSIDNAIIATGSSRWPLMIDPQTQANTWLKKMGNSSPHDQLVVLKMIGEEQASNTQKLERAIQSGQTVLLEEVSDKLDPSFDSIFSQSVFEEDRLKKIKFGDKSLLYDSNFRLMLTTKIQNPHFLPEICIKLAVINFAITFEGLEEQMLVDVIKIEAPEVEEQRDSLIIKLAQSRNDLYKLQSKILDELNSSNSETILDNVVLIETLEICSSESITIAESLKKAEQVEIKINETRNAYRVTATRGSLIYFSIVEMSQIDPMYQNSLTYVKQLFNTAIKSVVKPEGIAFDDLISKHLDAITDQLYRKICVGLFETHKLIFAFLMCTRIKKHAKNIDPTEWSVFIRGADINQIQEAPPIQWLTAKQWAEAASVPGLQESLTASRQKWREFAENQTLQQLPNDLEQKLTAFQLLFVVKILKQELLTYGVQRYLASELGAQFATSPTSSLEALFSDGDRYTPIIFILSQGVDPTEQILTYSKSQADEKNQKRHQKWELERVEKEAQTPVQAKNDKGVKEAKEVELAKYSEFKLDYKSLGQGQERIAEEMITRGMRDGNWVLLQNCHLFKSWMGKLESICSRLGTRDDAAVEGECHEDFKLILTSMPVDYFPVSVLQNSLKMTTDPPKGIKANLKRTYTNIITEETYDELTLKTVSDTQTQHSGFSELTEQEKVKFIEKQKVWRKLLFCLAFFHAVVQERRKFGPTGWNIRYEFSDADLTTSIKMLQNFIQDNSEVPWESIKFMTGQINYGGRVTDGLDNVLLMCTLSIYQNEEIMAAEMYQFSASGKYRCPTHSRVEEITAYIDQLPEDDQPEIFGMHQNANLTYLRAKSDILIETILSVQPREYSAGAEGSGMTSDEQVIEIAGQLLEQIPEVIPSDCFHKEILKLTPNGLLSCLSTVLLQEVQRYNRLLVKMTASLESLISAVKGIVLMSVELDLMYTALFNNLVPQNWKSVSYLSLKKLTSWVADLKERVSFMRTWATKGHPKCYWLSGFFFPHGFITSVLQTYARKHTQPIDLLKLDFEICEWQQAKDVEAEPAEGVYIYGLYLESARWSMNQEVLCDQLPGEMSCAMPVIHFIPVVQQKKNKDVEQIDLAQKGQFANSDQSELYKCPVYKTSQRAGTLSTTGQSTNFILSIDLPCGAFAADSNSESAYATGQTTASNISEGSVEHWTLRGTALLTMLDD